MWHPFRFICVCGCVPSLADEYTSANLFPREKCFSFDSNLLKYAPMPPIDYKWALLLLTHWGRETHICVGDPIIIGSDNGLSPDRRQAINLTNDIILLIVPLRTNFSEIVIEVQTFSFNIMRSKVSSAKWRPFCLGLNVLMTWHQTDHCYKCHYLNQRSHNPPKYTRIAKHYYIHYDHFTSVWLTNISRLWSRLTHIYAK